MIQSHLLKYFVNTEKQKEIKRYYFIFIPAYNRVDLKKYSGSQYYKE